MNDQAFEEDIRIRFDVDDKGDEQRLRIIQRTQDYVLMLAPHIEHRPERDQVVTRLEEALYWALAAYDRGPDPGGDTASATDEPIDEPTPEEPA